MKKFIINLFGLVALTINLSASTAVTAVNLGGINSAAGTNATVVAGACVTEGMTFYSTNTTPSVVFLYDGFYFKTNAAYTNYTVSVGTTVIANVTTTGITNNYTNTVLKTTANAVAATTTPTVEAPVVSILIPGAPSGGVGLVTFNDSVSFAQRMTISNSLPGVSYLVNYRSP